MADPQLKSVEMLSPSRKYTLGEIDAVKKAWVERVAHSTGSVLLYLKRVDQGLSEIDEFFRRPVVTSRSGPGAECQPLPTPGLGTPE